MSQLLSQGKVFDCKLIGIIVYCRNRTGGIMKVRTDVKAGSAENIAGCENDYDTGYYYGYENGYHDGCLVGEYKGGCG
jgi:hypothetical protein